MIPIARCTSRRHVQCAVLQQLFGSGKSLVCAIRRKIGVLDIQLAKGGTVFETVFRQVGRAFAKNY